KDFSCFPLVHMWVDLGGNEAPNAGHHVEMVLFVEHECLRGTEMSRTGLRRIAPAGFSGHEPRAALPARTPERLGYHVDRSRRRPANDHWCRRRWPGFQSGK